MPRLPFALRPGVPPPPCSSLGIVLDIGTRDRSSAPQPSGVPRFVSFEGVDGSGKSTQARRLAGYLRGRGLDVVEVREPGGTGAGERIRALVLDPDAAVAPRTEALLFAAARAELVEEIIEPALARGATVVAD